VVAAVLRPAPVNLAVASVLFLLPWAVAVVKVHHHHLDSGAVGLAATFSLGLPALWLAVAAYLEAGRPEQATELTMTHVADQLAIAVGAQWEAEARIRRLNDPYPLPVSWTAAGALSALTDSWDSLVRLATSGAGWPEPPPEGSWASGPDDLAGEAGELADVLGRVPTGRLVVLGKPGAGKTILMVRLVMDLLARRASGGPVPILASIASWNPVEQDLRDWLDAQLIVDHPALASPPPTGRTEPTQAAALLASGLIMPVLDGLDEIPEQVRGPAISRINDALRPGEQVVVTCRSVQYIETIRPASGVEVMLRGAAAVHIRPLDVVAIRRYLSDDAAGPAAKARWLPVFRLLGTEAPVGQALRTPLMVGLARVIYNPRPGESADALRDPAELCSPALTGRSAVERLLFDAFIPAAYRPPADGRWTATQAETWLIFLARHLEQTIGSPNLAWWQLRQAMPKPDSYFMPALVCGLVSGLVSGLVAGLSRGLVAGLLIGLSSAVVSWLVSGPVLMLLYQAISILAARGIPGPRLASTRGLRLPMRISLAVSDAGKRALELGSAEAPARRMQIRVTRFAVAFAAGLLYALVPGLLLGVSGKSGFVFAFGFALVFGLVLGLVFGLATMPGDLARVTSPSGVLARDRRVALLMIALGVAVGLVAGPVVALTFGSTTPLVYGLAIGFAAGYAVGYGLSVRRTAWPSYILARVRLALHHDLPWSLMDFLDHAHKRGVLRLAGAVYQFRHIELQHRLANRETGKQYGNSSSAARHRGGSRGGQLPVGFQNGA
jgi:NACHT domain